MKLKKGLRVKLKKARLWSCERGGLHPQIEVEMYGEAMEVASSFKYLTSCLSKVGRPQEDMKKW